MRKGKLLSIIIVNYKAKKDLTECIASIQEKIKNISYEIIVVENDPGADIGSDLQKFNFLKYFKAKNNLGYGAGNNFGATFAKGEYFFFLNPDTVIKNGSIKDLIRNFKKRNIGIVAPLLLDTKGSPYALQGTLRLNIINAIFGLSFINKIFPDNPISRKFWLKDRMKNKTLEADVIPGTAFLISKKLFDKLKGFDEEFFLFFEENDICDRARDLGYKIIIDPSFKIIHKWGVSTRKEKNINKIFSNSRYIYFKKSYGIVIAFLINTFLSINALSFILILIFLLGFLIRAYRINDLMMFIPDQGWFYLSAKNLVFGQEFPLVGITSSHTWLNQGPYWTYLLAAVFFWFGFNPVNGAYLGVFIGMLTLLILYIVTKEIFGRDVALISVILYAFSPLVVVHSRMAYHTNPIPLFMVLFIFSIFKWLRGNFFYFPIMLFFLGVLYNFELFSQTLWAIVILFLFYAAIFKREIVRPLMSFSGLSISLIAFSVPLIPIIIYDFSHGFRQTIIFAGWAIVYKPLTLLIESGENTFYFSNQFVNFMSERIGRLILGGRNTISIILLLSSVLYISFQIVKMLRGNKEAFYSYLIIFSTVVVPITVIGFLKIDSEAYLPILFPQIIICISIFISYILNKLLFKKIAYVVIFSLAAFNIYYLIKHQYLMNQPHGYGISLNYQVAAAENIIKAIGSNPYNIISEGNGKIDKSAVLNYNYLLWWLGNPPSENQEKLTVIVTHEKSGIKVVENISGKKRYLFFVSIR